MIRMAFVNPFLGRHCAPIAWAHVAGLDAPGAVALAAKARETVAPDTAWYGKDSGTVPLLDKRGSAYSLGANDKEWARLSGVTIGEPTKYPAARFGPPTLAQFRATHRTGRWLVFVQAHVVALIDGRYFGSWKPRCRVQQAIPVTSGGRAETPRAETPRAETPRAARAVTTKALRIADIIRDRIKSGWTTDKILESVWFHYPAAATSRACVAYYRTKVRKENAIWLSSRWSISTAPPARRSSSSP